MLSEKEGRSRTIRTSNELYSALREEIASLSPEERSVMELMLQEMKEDGAAKSSIFEAASEGEYKRPLVDMETFVRDREYLGNTCDICYDKILEDLTELFSGGYHEAIFTGSIGWGKTFAASIGICRVLYELSCMHNPHKSFHLASGSNISIVGLSVNENLATKVVFENVATKIKASPYFQENFQFKATKKELRFPGNIWVAARATTDGSVLGLNIIAALIDETNFMHKVRGGAGANARWGVVDHAEMLYASIKRRIKSRFERRGRNPGIIFVVSSKKTSDDFTAKRILDAKNDPGILVRDYATWDVKPYDIFSESRFHVLVGNDQIASKIVDDDEELAELEGELPDGCVLIKVPDNYRLDFESDLEGAIRDMAGIATVAVSPYIQRREKIVQAIQPTREHPFSVMSYDPSKYGTFMWDRMVRENTNRSRYSDRKLRPIVNPDATRHIHIDPSLTGCATGLCMAHVASLKDVIRRADDGRQFIERAPIYYIDFILQILPPTGGEIVLADIRHLIYDLTAHGYLINIVSLDSWQSADSIQTLKSQGYNAELVSMDTTPDAYDNIKMAFYEDRVIMYNYPPVIDELIALQEDRTGRKRKIDHPPNGSKDCSDALAGCCFTLSRNALSEPMPIMTNLRVEEDAWMTEQQQVILAGEQEISDELFPPIIVGAEAELEW